MGSDTRNPAGKPGLIMPTVLGIAVFFLVLVPCIVVALIFGLHFLDEWNYSRQTANVAREMASAGFLPRLPEAKSYARLPDFAVPSPDGAWTFTAQWVDTRGYNWGLRENRTRRTYFRTDVVQPDHAFDPRVAALWSPDGSYVAITLSLGGEWEYVKVIHVMDPAPTDTDLPSYAALTPDKALVEGPDRMQVNGLVGTQSEALRWDNATDLAEIVYIRVALKDGTERAIGVHQILRFHENFYEVRARAKDFYEILPARS